MKVLETKYIDVKDIIIGRCLARPIEEMKEDNEDLKNLSNSIEELGQLHPCTVRIVDNKYELIAGGRRYVVLSQKDNPIEVKVVDATDLEALELGITENLHRKNLDDKQRDTQIYRLWKYGEKSGQYKCIRDIAKKIAMSEGTLRDIITEGDTREKHKESEIIQKAKTRELVKTRPLSEHLELREKILDLGHKKDITVKDMGEISKKIKTTIDNGVDKKIVEKAIDLASISKDISEEKKRDITTDNTNTSTRSSVFQPKKFTEVLDTLKVSPPDVKEKIIKKEISLEDAKALNRFSTVEARKQVLKEIKTIENKKEVAQRIFDKDIERNLEIRKKQEEDMKKKGETQLKTEFDVELEKKLEKESNKDDIHDEEFVDRYQRLSSYTLGAFSHFHPKKLRTVEGKNSVLKIIRNLYELYQKILIESGEIKEVRPEGRGDNVKRLEAGDVKIVKRT